MARSDKLLKKLLSINIIIVLLLFCSALITFMFGDCDTQNQYVNNIGYIVLTLIFGHVFFIIFYIYFLPLKKQE
ncbi:MAG: hypothetical protein ACQPRI_02165 [Solitalea-like symbiont of Tyrophagus putrescentiae]